MSRVESIRFSKAYDVQGIHIKKPLKGIYGTAKGPSRNNLGFTFQTQPETQSSTPPRITFLGSPEGMQNYDKLDAMRDKITDCEKLFISNLVCKGISIRYVLKTAKLESFCDACYAKVTTTKPNTRKKNKNI